jgi:hypothetical protein
MLGEDDDASYVGKLSIGRNMHLAGIWRLIYMKGCLIQNSTHRWRHLVYPLVRLTNHQLIAETM